MQTVPSPSTKSNGTKLTMAECITRCLDCYRACTEAAGQCLAKGGKHADAPHQSLLRDCAEICRTSADFMVRGSQHHHLTCGVSAKICEACAVSCEALGDAEMKACAEACRRCAESCGAMSSTH